MSSRLFVGNLSYETTGDELLSLFSEIGEVASCNLITDRETGRSKGFAFVEMNSTEAAETAKQKINGQNLHGRALKVDAAKARGADRG
jgi:cold-inducible RNA-binding protein